MPALVTRMCRGILKGVLMSVPGLHTHTHGRGGPFFFPEAEEGRRRWIFFFHWSLCSQVVWFFFFFFFFSLNRFTCKESKDADMNGEENEGRALGAKTKTKQKTCGKITRVSMYFAASTRHTWNIGQKTLEGKGLIDTQISCYIKTVRIMVFFFFSFSLMACWDWMARISWHI
ncbi:hypothetical protein QBC42DRAFT_25407 [Cladorrhinum samala]|uniref:Uncharacterized protein n=1 Tax=Cladorrhinum samala TaxID=585594 RepID=A0AAV9HDZ7_9PEZI|nr:hypothetical protein QBC42DRAFT_25407 [Cladorrhinum samala]